MLHRTLAVIAGALVAIGLVAGTAMAGQFRVASCQADQLNFSTSAFGDFATRGMKITRACNPEGPGLRGLITANVVQSGAVARGAVSLATITAPPGSSFTTFRWAGTLRRRDCRYALQLYADVPGGTAIAIKNVRANQGCSGGGVAQAAGYRARTFNVTGATRIVQRVVCQGAPGRNVCSGRGANYIRTYQAQLGVTDDQPPTATIGMDTPLAGGAWIGGSQALNYDAQDNGGVRLAEALGSGQRGGFDQRPCEQATPDGAFATPVPCPNGPGQIAVDTRRFSEGTQQLVVQAQDAAGNLGSSEPVTVRIDNTPPPRVDVRVEGGEQWRNRNDFALSWVNAQEPDRAPIAAATYKLCAAAGGGSCNQVDQVGDSIAGLPVQVPAAGEWTVSVWRRDGAGNQDPNTASVPVTLRYDPEPPQLGFEQPAAADPTLVAVQVTDKVSGLAGGSIELSPAGSNTWRTLDTQKDASRLTARIDDATLPAGSYLLRSTARDQAGNEASTTQRLDGQVMALTLPLRAVTTLQAGVSHTRIVRGTVYRGGKRRITHKRVTELSPAARVPFGRTTQVTGRLATSDGQGVAGAEVQVLSRSDASAEQLVGIVQTDAAGDYAYAAAPGTSRTLRFAYAGSAASLPAQGEVRLQVPAASSLNVNRVRVLNGQAVTFTGRVPTQPIPAGGKLVELQVLLSGRWQTFRTGRTDEAGRWALPYRFARTRGLQRFRFRVSLPREGGYPFVDGTSDTIQVQVRGR